MATSPQRGTPNIKLRTYREQRHLTQAELAEQIGATEVTVSRWERGESFPTPYNIRQLCEVFQTTAEELGLDRNSRASNPAKADTKPIPQMHEGLPEQAAIPQTSIEVQEQEVIPQTSGEYQAQAGVPQTPIDTEYQIRAEPQVPVNGGHRRQELVPSGSSFVALVRVHHTRRLLLLGLLGILIIAIGIGAVVFYANLTTTHDIAQTEATMHTFCTALINHDFSTAYNQFAPQLKQPDLVKEINKKYTKCKPIFNNADDRHAQYILTLTSGAKRSYVRVITLEKNEQGHWQISDYGKSQPV